MTDNGTPCAFPCLLLCGSLYIFLVRPTNVAHFLHLTTCSAPTLLPQPVSSSNCGACSSTLCWSFFAALLGLAPATLLPLTLHTLCFAAHLFQYTILFFCKNHLFDALRADLPHVHRHLPFRHQGVSLWPLDAQIESFARDGPLQASSRVSMKHFENMLSLPKFPSHPPSVKKNTRLILGFEIR